MNKLSPSQTFIIFCIETYKNKIKTSGYAVLEDFIIYDVFKFLEAGYEVLHTQSLDYTAQEIDEYIKNRK